MQVYSRIIFFRLFPFLLIAMVLIGLERIYFRMHSAVVDLGGADQAWLYIPTGATFGQVKDSLYRHGYISRKKLLENYIEARQYDNRFKPGRYRLRNHMSVGELVDMLVRGLQTPVKVSFHQIRTQEELAGRIASQIEADSLSLIRLFRNRHALEQYHVTPLTLFTLTIPNTYEMWWNSTAADFLSRMGTESQKFWNGPRKFKADSIGLTLHEVITLASIVEKETAMNDEKPVIAGVYMNRLGKLWPLQADPTLIFAWNDYSIKRVLNRHKEIRSPYNTYLHRGLPPGPICLPSVASIDAVLNFRSHDYLYFCAKEDFSGYHVYTSSLSEHNRNARRYQQAVMKLRIEN